MIKNNTQVSAASRAERAAAVPYAEHSGMDMGHDSEPSGDCDDTNLSMVLDNNTDMAPHPYSVLLCGNMSPVVFLKRHFCV